MASRDSAVIGLFGAGGFGREVMPLLRQQLMRAVEVPEPHRTFFVESAPERDEVAGIPCISEEDFFAIDAGSRYFNTAVADSRLRARVAMDWISRGAVPLSVRSQSAEVIGDCQIGPGSILCSKSIITADTQIGTFFHANLFSYVAHDCVVGDFVSLAPRASINGRTEVGNHAYIGTGAVIREGEPGKPRLIGEGAVIGMGAVVTKDVAPHTTVVGNPARPLGKDS